MTPVRNASVSISRHDDPVPVTQYALFSFQKPDTRKLDEFIHSKLNSEELETYQALKPKIYGIGKIRGVFSSEEKASQRAREIIEHIDHHHSIFTCIVGQFFPLVEEGFANEVEEVNLQKEVSDHVNQSISEKELKDTKERHEIEQRREKLLCDVEKPCDNNVDSLDYYIQTRVKFAHLQTTMEQHVDLYHKCIDVARQCLEPIQTMQQLHPEFQEIYMEKYIAARREAHIPENTDTQGFMKYMGIPIDASQIPSCMDSTCRLVKDVQAISLKS